MNFSPPDRSRRILFLQDHQATGGAAIAGMRYAAAVRGLGLTVATASGDAQPGANVFRLSGKPERGLARIPEFFLSGPARIRRRKARVKKQWAGLLAEFRPDLIWVHNLQGGEKWGWSPDLLKSALQAGPVLWTLHDMWSLGQGPAYFDEEEAARHPGQGLLARIVADHRNGNRLRVTVPSDWLGRLARQKAPGICRRLDYVLDTREFHPGLRDTGREKLGLQEKDFMLITAAENLGDSRKGLDLLRQAWSQLRKQKEHVNLRLGLVGRGGMGGLLNDSRVIWLGKSNPGASLAMWMAAADLFVHPASLDNYPLVLQESQACGTPVLAFDRGGIRETFEPDRTGWLLADRSIPALVGKLREIIQTPGAAAAMRNRARERMLDAQAPGKFTAEWTALSATTSNGTFVPVGNPS